MPNSDWTVLLRDYDRPLLLLSFFGTFALLAALEVWRPRDSRPAARGRRWGANGTLTLLYILTNALAPVSLIAAADFAAERQIGLLHALPIGLPALIAIGLLVRSLTAWASHVLLHKSRLLWRIHRVHHLDTGLDVSTSVRFHPLEAVYVSAFALPIVMVLGVHPAAVLLYELAEAAQNCFAHANLRLPPALERMLRLLFITPDLHRVHHSSHRPETDSNFGSTLSIWDRIFGTYREKPQDALASQEIGLEECRDSRTVSVPWLLASPLLELKSGHGAERAA